MRKLPKGVEIVGPLKPGYEKILTPDALAFLAKLVRKHAPTRKKLLAYRAERQSKIDEELFDVVAGVEALAAAPTGTQPGKRREYG